MIPSFAQQSSLELAPKNSELRHVFTTTDTLKRFLPEHDQMQDVDSKQPQFRPMHHLHTDMFLETE